MSTGQLIGLLAALLGLGLAASLARGWARRGRTSPSPEALGDAAPVGEDAVLAAAPVENGGVDAAWRQTVTALLLGGVALVLLTQLLYATWRPAPPRTLALFTLAGLLAFLGGGYTYRRPDFFLWRSRPIVRLTSFLGLRPGQVALWLMAVPLVLLARLAAGDGLQARHAPVAMLAWLLAVGAVVAGSIRSPSATPAAAAERRAFSRREIIVVVVFFVLAFGLRGVLLEVWPTTLAGDEASAGLAAVRFLDGEATNPFGLGWFSFPALYFAVQSVGIWMLGQTTEGLRILSAIAGALTVAGVYVLGRVLFDRLTAVLAALFLTGAHYHVHFSRIGLNNIWDGLFLTIALSALWVGWRTGRRAAFIICGLAVGLSQYFYVSIRVLPVLLLIWCAAAFWRRRERFRARWPDLLLAGGIALVVFLPLALFFVRHPAEFNAPLQRVSVFNGWLESEMALTELPAWRLIGRLMGATALGFTHVPLRQWYNPGTPLLLPIAGGLFLLGVLWSLFVLGLRHLLLLLPVAATVILGGLSQDAPASQRFVLVMPVVAILVALPLAQGASWLRRLWPAQGRALVAGAVLVMGVIAAADARFYFFDVYETYTLGGPNTRAATAVAHYLASREPVGQTVYFFGFPRMGYHSFSTIPYLAPSMDGQDVTAPLTAPPDWPLAGPTIFVFLPERVNELTWVESAYPGGATRQVADETMPAGIPLFVAYEVTP